MGLFDDQQVSIYPSSSSSIRGIFYLLNELNGEYRSRYSIKGQGRTGYLNDCIDNINHSGRYWSIDDDYNITFSFDSPLFVSHYSIMNSSPDGGNSYPKSWQLFGKDYNEKLHLIDSRTNQNFANGKTEVVKTYSTHSRKAYKEYFWLQKESSSNYKWVDMRRFELFGTLCSKTGYCRIPLFIRTCKIKYHHSFSLIYSFMITIS